MAETNKAGKNIVTVNPYGEGFLPKKASLSEPTADMNRDALDALFSTDFSMVDSRAAEIIGSRGQSTKAPTKELSFSELAKAGVDFHDKKHGVSTIVYSPARIIEALDRHLTATHHIGADTPKLAYTPGVGKTLKKPIKSKAPTTTTFDKLYSGGREFLFSGHGLPKTRQPMFSLQAFIAKHHKG